MAESQIAVTPGSGVNVAGYTDSAGNFRQTVTLGDTTNNVALLPSGVQLESDGGASTLAVASAKTSVTVISATTGRLCKVLVTASNTSSVSFYDNSATTTGTIVGLVPASAALGAVYSFQFPVSNGITGAGSAGAPGYTVSFV